MRSTFFTTAAAAAAALFSSASALDTSLKTNVAVYWGQGPNQQRLSSFCASSNIDIVVLGFINVFPDQGPGGWPGSNFGNACGAETFAANGVATKLLSQCSNIAADIQTCQQTYGKTVLLSIGGDSPGYYLKNSTTAQSFAEFLWGSFGPYKQAWVDAGNPRPFDTAVVDGFDFDIESFMQTPPTADDGTAITDYQSRGYADMAVHFKTSLYPQDSSKAYYLSAAPQCVTPDSHLADAIAKASFDFIFVQFYNTPWCSTRAGINYAAGAATNDITFVPWTQVASKNPNVKVYIGMPGSTEAVPNDASSYLSPAEANSLVKRFISNAKFGGIMVWEATYSANNLICNKDYAYWMKKVLVARAANAAFAGPACTSTPVSSKTVTSTVAVTSVRPVVVTTTRLTTITSTRLATVTANKLTTVTGRSTVLSNICTCKTATRSAGKAVTKTLTGAARCTSAKKVPVCRTATSIKLYTTTKTTLVQSTRTALVKTTKIVSVTSTRSSTIVRTSTFTATVKAKRSYGLYPTAATDGAYGGYDHESAPYGNTTSTGMPAYTTSTVYRTSVYTVTSCPPSVPNCPAESRYATVVTSTIDSYTTVCPVATDTGVKTYYYTPPNVPVKTTHITSTTTVTLVESTEYTTSTVVYASHSKPSSVYTYNAVASHSKATSYSVESVTTTLTMEEYTAPPSLEIYPTESTTTSILTMSTITMEPIPIKNVNATTPAYGPTGGAGTASVASYTPTYTSVSPAQYTGAASRSGVGASLFAVLAAGALLL